VAAPAGEGAGAGKPADEMEALFSGDPFAGPKPRGGSAAPVEASGVKAKAIGGAPTPDEVKLQSARGLDYGPLKELLAAGEFEKADDETRAKLIEMAGPSAVERGWVFFTEVRAIPEEDLRTVDRLWQAYSDGKFGYSVQRKVWIKARRQWSEFFAAIDWTQGENANYRKWPEEFRYDTMAPRGHLPLTNCLRGTQLFAEVMEHPAFLPSKSKAAAASKTAANIGKAEFKI